jgi:uncharacterized protein
MLRFVSTAFDEAGIYRIERPDPKLMQYYTICCLFSGPLFPITIIPQYFKYHTMRYRFDEEGISMRWGILFRREVILNYSRIQDIHLTSNILERWLGLARLQIQTASGSSSAEMTIEGLVEYESVRDFLYSKMRGQKEGRRQTGGTVSAQAPDASPEAAMNVSALSELTAGLASVTAELRAIREELQKQHELSSGKSDAPNDQESRPGSV